MSNILLTGGSGFVGRNLIHELDKEADFNIEKINFRDPLPISLPPFQCLIHLAGIAHDIKNVNNDKEYFEINYEKTKILFDLFLASEGKDFIYFSSVKAVADTLDKVLEEDEFPNPQTSYGLSKLKAEEYLLSQLIPKNKRVFILRPSMIHGPGNKGNLNLLYNIIKKGIPYPLGAFENIRSFLSIDNLIYILVRIINEPEIAGGIYNVADDKAISTRELIKIISISSSSPERIWYFPKSLILMVAKIGDIFHIPFNSEVLKKLTESYVVSNRKIKRALGISQLPVSVHEGLGKTIKSFKNN
ncbi:MAG: NAD-dependent epimerase/dehydratase family protein [Ferruginibacter sp.]